ncbi:hypothetical protein Salat_1432800 [Sesamum alatum]|uniref:DUF4378 domain-containing protein n=1 Tax=Sesamum alatum TaxID=300844 RepID=A0AAE1YAD9_9LAMI|nr:hypothetical protein Salat_1432800 [Sesamum alatum]
MNDTLDKTASSLAVVEKKPHRPGGCVGIFFQLFDWNRRFAKKKLFSKKLLPPVRLRQVSKKFAGDEKQPKLRLIADENSGGFPAAKNNNGGTNDDHEQKHETRVPGLVARLMGLESMPALQREKSKKVPASGFVSGKAEKFVDCDVVREEVTVEKGGIKHESRPQKLQRTSVSERLPITRLGSEKLPFKNVLSKSRKHQHPKLPSPVKSPRHIPRKNPSKLIGAATRILEPGLQTSRLKCALTYSNTLRHPAHNTVMEERTHSLSSQLECSDGLASVDAKGQPCRNCGYLLDRSRACEQPVVFASPSSHCVGSSCQGSERSKPGNSAFYQDLGEELLENYPAVAAPGVDNLQSHVNFTSYKSPFSGQIQWHSGSQQCKPPTNVPVSLSPNHKTQIQNQMFRARDIVPPRSKLNNSPTSSKVSTATVMNGAKDFVSANQSFSTRSRPPARMDNGKFEQEKRIANRRNESVPPGRKRRPANVSRQGDTSVFMSSTGDKQSFGSPHAMPGRQLGDNVHVINRQRNRSGLIHLQKRTVDSGQMNNNVVSFTFNSPVKQKTGIREVAEKRVPNDLHCHNSLQKSPSRENDRRERFEKPFPLSEDALGALLEQKLKELTSQGDDVGSNAPKKTTAMILQELISALTSEIPFQQDLPATTDGRNNRCDHSHLSKSTSITSSQANVTAVKLSFDQQLESGHPSPGSVLETHFSTESCPSSSLDDTQGYKLLSESLDCSYYGPRLPNLDSELFDSAASTKTTDTGKELVIYILDNVSEILCCNDLSTCGLKGDKLDQAKEVLVNAELVFQNAALSGSVLGRGFPIKHLLLDELDTLASVLWMNFGCSLGIEDGKEVNQLKRFVLDSIIEHLGSRFEGYPKAGSKVSRKLPLRTNTTNTLIFEIVDVVRRWEDLSRFGLDELIEKEMTRSLGVWTRCENEAFETGMEISRHVFQVLLDEIVRDLWN